MASPFEAFRRHQRVLLAVTGISAMIAFVFFGPWNSAPRSEGPNPVVVRMQGGDIHAGELYSIISTRDLAMQFVGAVLQQNIQAKLAGMDDKSYGPMLQQYVAEPILRDLFDDYNRIQRQPEQSAVELALLTREASKQGFVVSDDAVNEYIKSITDATVRPQLNTIIKSLRARGGGSVSQSQVFEALRRELLVSRFRRSFLISLQGTTPAERFSYYERLNRQARVELVALDVKDFVDKVREPRAEELKEFFEKYRDRLPLPGSPDPGFKQPKLAAFDFLKADFAKFVAAAAVSDKEIVDYYEKNKVSEFRTSKLPAEKRPIPRGDLAPPEPKQPTQDADKSDAKAETVPEADGAKSTEAAASEATALEATLPKANADAKSETESSTRPADAKSTKAEQDKSASQANAGRLSFASMLQPKGSGKAPVGKGPAPATKTPVGKAPAAKGKANSGAKAPVAKNPPAQASRPESPAATDKAAKEPLPAAKSDEKTDDTAAAKADASVQEPEPDAPEPATSESASADDNAKGQSEKEQPEFEPLDKVREQIRSALARPKANEAIRAAFDQAIAELRDYGDRRALAEANPGTNAPEPVDVKKLAAAHGLEPFQTKMTSVFEAGNLENIGSSYVLSDNGQTISFVQLAFGRTSPTYQPTQSEDDAGNRYLWWKTDDTDEKTLDFDGVKKHVREVWRLIQARDYARKQAETYAAKARKLGGPLSSTLPKSATVYEAGPFSWLTTGSAPSPDGRSMRLSKVEHVDEPGEGFFRAVFDLQKNGVGVAINQPQTQVYVVRLLDYDPSQQALQEIFAREEYGRYASAGGSDMQSLYLAWINSMERDAGLQWERDPDSRRQQ